MTNELFIKIVSAIITIITALITAYVIPWLKTRINNNQLEQLQKYIELAVRCAEQIYTPDQWIEKKEFVLNYITETVNDKFSLTLDYVDIDLMIEGIVNEVKKK